MGGVMWLIGIVGLAVLIAGFALAGHPAVIGTGALLVIVGLGGAMLKMFRRERRNKPPTDPPGFKRVN